MSDSTPPSPEPSPDVSTPRGKGTYRTIAVSVSHFDAPLFIIVALAWTAVAVWLWAPK